MAVYRYGKKTSDINVQPDFNVKDTKSDAFIKNRPDSTLSISLNGVEQNKHYNPNTGSETIDIDLTDVLANQDSILQETIESLTVDSVGSNGGYIKTIKEDNGKITATRQAFDTSISDSSTDNNSPTSKAVYTAIQSLGNVFHVRDSVATFKNLPTTGNTAGDVRNVLDTDDNYVWTGTAWDPLGGSSIINTLNYTGADSAGTATQFITQVTQSKGQISATKSSLPTSSTSTAGIVKLNNTLTSTSTTEALSAAQGKVLKDLADSKQASGSYKTTQTAKSDPTANGTTITAIDTISQDTNGVITATKKTIRSATTSQTGVVKLNDSISSNSTSEAATANAVKTVQNNLGTHISDGSKHVPANGTTNSGKFLKSTGTAGSYEWSELENIVILSATSSQTPIRDTRYYIGTANLTTTINKPSRVGLMITVIANIATTIKYPNNSGTVQTQSLGVGTVQVLYSAENGYISGFYGALWNI